MGHIDDKVLRRGVRSVDGWETPPRPTCLPLSGVVSTGSVSATLVRHLDVSAFRLSHLNQPGREGARESITGRPELSLGGHRRRKSHRRAATARMITSITMNHTINAIPRTTAAKGQAPSWGWGEEGGDHDRVALQVTYPLPVGARVPANRMARLDADLEAAPAARRRDREAVQAWRRCHYSVQQLRSIGVARRIRPAVSAGRVGLPTPAARQAARPTELPSHPGTRH